MRRRPAEAEAARSNRAGRMAYSSHFREPETPKSAPFVPRTPPPLPRRSLRVAPARAGGEAYWDLFSEAQEVWALRKVGYFKVGQWASDRSSNGLWASDRSRTRAPFGQHRIRGFD